MRLTFWLTIDRWGKRLARWWPALYSPARRRFVIRRIYRAIQVDPTGMTFWDPDHGEIDL